MWPIWIDCFVRCRNFGIVASPFKLLGVSIHCIRLHPVWYGFCLEVAVFFVGPVDCGCASVTVPLTVFFRLHSIRVTEQLEWRKKMNGRLRQVCQFVVRYCLAFGWMDLLFNLCWAFKHQRRWLATSAFSIAIVVVRLFLLHIEAFICAIVTDFD